MNNELERPYSISKYGNYTVQNVLKEHIFHKTLLILI
jgi:hypothetical protein